MENATSILFGMPGVAVERVERTAAGRLVHVVTTAPRTRAITDYSEPLPTMQPIRLVRFFRAKTYTTSGPFVIANKATCESVSRSS